MLCALILCWFGRRFHVTHSEIDAQAHSGAQDPMERRDGGSGGREASAGAGKQEAPSGRPAACPCALVGGGGGLSAVCRSEKLKAGRNIGVVS